jgi:hypothetical protein
VCRFDFNNLNLYAVLVGDIEKRQNIASWFFERFVYVLFKDGKLITDKKEWVFHEREGEKNLL